MFSRCVRTYCFKNTALSFSHYCLLCLWTSKEGDSRIYTIRMLVLIRPPVKISHYAYRVTIYQVFRHTENLKGGYRIASRWRCQKNIDFVERVLSRGHSIRSFRNLRYFTNINVEATVKYWPISVNINTVIIIIIQPLCRVEAAALRTGWENIIPIIKTCPVRSLRVKSSVTDWFNNTFTDIIKIVLTRNGW